MVDPVTGICFVIALLQTPATLHGLKELYDRWKNGHETKALQSLVGLLTIEKIKLFKAYHSLLPSLLRYTLVVHQHLSSLKSRRAVVDDSALGEQLRTALRAKSTVHTLESFREHVATLVESGYLPLLAHTEHLLDRCKQKDARIDAAITGLRQHGQEACPVQLGDLLEHVRQLEAALAHLKLDRVAEERPASITDEQFEAISQYLQLMAAFTCNAVRFSVMLIHACRRYALVDGYAPVRVDIVDDDCQLRLLDALGRPRAEKLVAQSNELILRSLDVIYDIPMILGKQKGVA